jgi:ATP-dependent RNA helicase DDX41
MAASEPAEDTKDQDKPEASRPPTADPNQDNYVSAKRRKEVERAQALALLQNAPSSHLPLQIDGISAPPLTTGNLVGDQDVEEQQQQQEKEKEKERDTGETLLLRAARLREEEGVETDAERLLREEEEIMRHLQSKKALKSVQELAKGTVYVNTTNTGWSPSLRIRCRTSEHHDAIRKHLGILVEGDHVPPPCPTFQDLRLPSALLRHLRDEKHITTPSPIQVQGLPCVLSGRDMIGIAFTGSGKTLVFSLPLVLLSLQEELRMPLAPGEGPLGFILAPSRELARQTAQIMEAMCSALAQDGWPSLHVLLTIGGVDMNAEMRKFVGSSGGGGRGGPPPTIHMTVGTTGRFRDMLKRKRLNLDICRYMCLDEADRMVDMGFEEEIREVMSYFKGSRQTLMFSATMPQKILSFAESALVDPVTVNVGRAGATNQDITQVSGDRSYATTTPTPSPLLRIYPTIQVDMSYMFVRR